MTTAGGLQSFASLDLTSTSPLGTGWSQISGLLNAAPPGALRLIDSRVAGNSYLGMLESLSNQDMNGAFAGVGFSTSMGGHSMVKR